MGYEGRARGSDHRGDQAGRPTAPKIGGVTAVQASTLSGAAAGKVGGQTRTEQLDSGVIQRTAQDGVGGAGQALPHRETIQRAFGHHDVSGVAAHVGGDAQTAAHALGAQAYATGTHVAFADAPSLHTAAHEAAHVVQQRAGVQLEGGMGKTGDTHEQHADAVADLVVQGSSAERLLDRYAGRASDGAARTTPGAAIQRAIDPQAIIKPLHDALGPLYLRAAALFDGVKDGTLEIASVTSALEVFDQAILDTTLAAAGNTDPSVAQAVDRAVGVIAPALIKAAEAIRAAAEQLANASSVAVKEPAKAVLPSRAQVAAFAGAAARLDQLARGHDVPASPDSKAQLDTAGTVTQDAALAMLQSLSVVTARERWKQGSSNDRPAPGAVNKGPRHEIDDVYKDAGWSDRADATSEWCGMFVVSSYFKGAGIAAELRAGFLDVKNVKDYFFYTQLSNPDRTPASIWAEGQWWGLRDYHKVRGSLRQWTARDVLQSQLAVGVTDIRPGDLCLIDHHGGDDPRHIVMVESYDAATARLVTIEGNTYGVRADKDGKAERIDDDFLKAPVGGAKSSSGLQERDLRRRFIPGPNKYTVNTKQAFVRDDANLMQFKLDNGKHVAIPIGPAEVTEVKDAGGIRFANVAGWGWTSFDNLTSVVPSGANTKWPGTTIWGIGRPSVVDFEVGHHYAAHAVPASLTMKSPEQMRELATKQTKDGAAARSVGLR